jgi:hypothetical protein
VGRAISKSLATKSEKMSLDELLALLDRTPVVADIHPISRYFLPDDVTVLQSTTVAVRLLDDPAPVLPGRWLITKGDKMGNGRFPQVTCHHNPFVPSLNSVLFDHFSEIASHMLCQSQLTERIVNTADKADLIVLLLIDGLSYQDVLSWENVILEPCLVDVPTVTRIAFPNLIGTPTLAERLFNAGYHHRLGFSYWTREDNPLTDQLFHTIPKVHKTGQFPYIIATLHQQLNESSLSGKTYTQIIRTGLDGFAHHQRRKPPITAIVTEIYQEVAQLVALCTELYQKRGWRTHLYVTSDHGILWFDECETVVIGTAQAQASARWCSWQELYHQTENGRRFLMGPNEYYCLGYPKLRRPPRIDEQGVHGGISFQESIVPFVTIRIG